MRKQLLKASIGVALVAAVGAVVLVPLAGARPAPTASVSASTASANCATYGPVSGKVKWSAMSVDTVSVEVGSNSGGLVGSVYGSQTIALTKAKSNGFVNYTIPANGTMDILGNTDVAVVAKFFSGGVESQTVAFTDLGVCTGQPDLVITSMTYHPDTSTHSTFDITVMNAGAADVNLDSSVTIQAYFSSSSDTSSFPPIGGTPPSAGGDPACGTSFAPTNNGVLAAGASKTLSGVSCGTANTSSDIWLVAEVDATNVIAESNENNNVFATSTT